MNRIYDSVVLYLACSTHRRGEKCMKEGWSENLKGSDHAVSWCSRILTFRKTMLPPSSRRNNPQDLDPNTLNSI